MKTWSADPLLQTASVSVLVQDMATGEAMMQLDSDRLLVPASVMKIFPTALMLQRYNAEHRFSTRLALSAGATIRHDTLYGDVILLGGGDPSLGSMRMPGADGSDVIRQQWVQAMQRSGIAHIAGRVVAVAGPFQQAFIPGGYAVEDAGNYFAAPASGLSFADNTYRLAVSSSNAGKPLEVLSVDPPIPGLTHTVVAVAAGTGDKAYIHGMPGSYNRVIAGTLEPNHDRFILKGAVPDPAWFAAWQCQLALEAAGISCSNDAIAGHGDVAHATILWEHTSPPLVDLLAHTLEKSDNLFAETWVRHLFHTAGPGREWQAMEDTIKSRFPNHFRGKIADGSGLSRSSAVSAADLTTWLIHQFRQPYREVWLEVLAEGGKEGTLRLLALPANFPGRLYGKSGYMTGVRSYAGYYQSASGNWYAFAMIANHYNGSAAAMRQAFSRVIQSFAQLP